MKLQRRRARRKLALAGLLVLLLLNSLPEAAARQVPAGKTAVEPEQAPAEVQTGPKDARERTGAYVFLVWLWSVIIVLVFVLRAKVKDVDRLHDMLYFDR